MIGETKRLIDQLEKKHTLKTSEYKLLIENYSLQTAEYARTKAVNLRKSIYNTDVYIRGLIEISNYCKNDCLYCGIRNSNKDCERYRLNKEEILECCNQGYIMGFRTFVLQGGEDCYFNDDIMCDIIKSIKTNFPNCAVTLSLGERTKKSYEKLFQAGANRYLLRHETADNEHYKKLHPHNLKLSSRIECLKNLKDIGYQVGCGFMVDSPYQTPDSLSKDLKFIEKFSPHMCGIGPFIPHKSTPFKNMPVGSFDITLYLLSIIRLIKPNILLPATTALNTVCANGRILGILSGANVVMPNLSPVSVRQKYSLYNNKTITDAEAAEGLNILKKQLKNIGYSVVCHRGDIIEL